MTPTFHTEKWIEVPGGRVKVRIAGEGPGIPLIVLHGGPGSTHDYLRNLAALGDEWPVVLYDQLGSGDSEHPGDRSLWRIERYVRELAAIVETLGYSRVHVLGHSWGTMLALDWFLAGGRERAASLAFVSPCLSGRRILGDMERLKRELPKAVLDTLALHEARGTTDSGAYRAAMRVFYQRHLCRLDPWPEVLASDEGFSWDVYGTMWGPSEMAFTGNLSTYEGADRLGEVDVPALFACGRHDEITPESTAAYHERTPGSRLEVFETSAHMPNLEEPERFLEVMRSFLHDAERRPATLIDLLRARAAEKGEGTLYTFLADGEVEEASLSYAGLDRRAHAIGARLQEAGAAGERALLLYPPGLDFIAAFFGCLCAGAVAVPAYPPRAGRTQPRLRSIAGDARPRLVLTTAAVAAKAAELTEQIPELAGAEWIATESLDEGLAERWTPPAVGPGTLAFLQYTSGSTAAPKGVQVTHGNLLHNERLIGEAFGMDEESVVVGWLPLYHDMGLIGNVLQPLHAGGRCVLMSPVAFLQRPMRWLEAISRYRGTVSGGPNFAYELCVRKASPEALSGLDLSSWRVAYNGAEPIRASTLERFAEAFAPSGFRREAFYPCYGLAEATLFVTGGHGSRVEKERVSCGGIWQRIVIADPETGAERPAGAEGEVWISGPSVARGYWENEEATARDFRAYLPSGEGPFLRTGDLGFLSGGELYVTGRLKDLIILRGRNLYPQDVELTAERAHPDLHPGGGAAFSVEIAGEERLVVVHEVGRHPKQSVEEIAEAVRRAVAAEHEAQVHEVVLIRQAGLPKTSSGKVQRRLCREMYLKDELPVVGRSALAAADPAPELAASLTRESLADLAPEERRGMLAAYLRERASAVVGAPVGLDQPLTGLGLDSLSAIELKGAVESALGLSLPLGDLLQGASVMGLADRLLAEAEIPPLRAHGQTGDAPLSVGQRGLWFLHRLAPEGSAYNIAVAARVRGLDPAALGRALSSLVDRHEALRTIFPIVGDEPVQRVLPHLAPDVKIEEDLSRLPEEAWRPFNLETGPLLRARIFTTADETVLLLVVHHVVADFASLAVMARDLSALYRGEALEPLGLRYADYVRWQSEMLAGPRGERQWAYWRDELAGLRDLDLPVDHPRPPVQTWRGDARAASLPPDLLASLGALASDRGATLFMALLAVFQAQLARYSGQEDFAVGSALSGRPLPELSGLVGYFVTLLPLRADLSGEPAFGELLGRARRSALGGMEHGDFPFPLLAERLRPVRDPARSPLFQAVLVLQRGRPGDAPGLATFSLGEEGDRVELGGLSLESVRLPDRRAQFDLTLFAAEDAHGSLRLSLEFNADLFDGGTAERMLGHLWTLLEGAVAAPETPIWHLPLLSESERGQFFDTWDDTACDYPRGQLLHQLFEAQVTRTPDAEAVVSGEARLTYAELNAQANRLAHRLRRLGIGPEDRVGVCLRRSEKMIVSLFAILKAGGAYVPLDPTYPRERLKGILEDSSARVVIGEEATAPRLAEESGDRWLSIEEDLSGESAENPVPIANSSNLAYLIYTSGSTGKPKAVAIEHRSPVVLMQWSREVFPPEELAGTLAATSIGFDVSVFEIFAPLSWGGRIFVVENLLALPNLPDAPEVRLVAGAPSVVAELVRIGRFPFWVRTVNLGGEAVPPALVEGLAAAAPGMRIVNAYGPSEDTTYTTIAFLKPGRPVAIGLPVANTRIYLLDGHGQPVPAGVPGELYIAGEGLSRGYLGRPELTAEKFVPNPFASELGARLYRVGDLARRRPDGLLDYLGRIDHQVKIRGFRVELGEIEAALAKYPGVREAVVVAREDGDRGKRLVAYVTPRGASSSELRSFLRESLPDYMVPAAFVHLDALPLSTNGKVDRKALPDPGAPAAAPAAVPTAREPMTEAVAALMAETLGRERMEAADDFFELGGHSLLATRLAARASRQFGIEVPVSAVLLYPTPAALAAQILAAGPGELLPAALEEIERRIEIPAAPEPVERFHESAGEIVAPRNEAEERLADIWRQVLGVERLGVHDDFFELGGHSLLAIRMLARIQQAFGIDLPLGDLVDAPTIAGLAERLEGRAGEEAPPPPPLLEAGEDLPLSFAQQRLWLLDQLDPGSPKYNVPIALRLHGRLEVRPLTGALGEIVRRHEPLRTVYARRGEAPVQTVLAAPAIPFSRIDLGGLPEEAREGAVWSALKAEAARPFDLARGPVVRFLLLELAPEESVLMAAFHHIATDGWSTAVFFRELVALYDDFAAGREPSLPEIPLRYADWAARQRADLEGGKLDSQLGYWRRQLTGVPGLELPTDRPRAAAGDRGGGRRVELPAGITAIPRGLVPGGGVTPFTLLLAGFAALLCRLTGQDDFAIGLPTAGRNRPQAEGLIGFFVNTLVARVRLGDDPPFRALLRRMRDTALVAQKYQDVPFERLVEELQPERSAGGTPFFQVALNFMVDPLARMSMRELEVSLLDVTSGTAKFDLTLAVYEEDGLRGWAEYRADLFDPATVERWMVSLRALVAGALADPELPLSELPLLAAAERWQTVAEWNDTGAAQLPDPRLHRLIEAQAARTPEAVAVSFEESHLTYAEMNGRANRIARRLRALGVGPEERVAVSLERSLDLVVALVAVLKAGGAYVPLDPSYPQERLSYMLEDSAARVLLDRDLLEREAEAIDAEDPSDLPDGAGPESLAYVIYTSGSTGRPKGAMNEHRAIVNRLLWMQDTYRLDATDRVLQKTPMSFDVSVWEFFWPLMTGARLVVARPGGHQDNAYLVDLIAREGITTLHFVPSMLALWLEEPGVERCENLRRVVVSGEALALEHERRFFERLPQVELHNLYGPTEAAVDVTWWPCAPGSGHRSVPIGRAIRNVAIHILDRGLRPVPVGAAGELLIGGVQVGRGYHGRPALTAERFVPDPFSAEPGRRLYRTGDLARRLPDGAVEYLGRIDHQVKIRGVRIELGEIESALREQASVRDAAAVVRQVGDDRRIIGYVVPHGEPGPELAAELRGALATRLPEAMVPAAFVFLDALPLSPNGKLDRAALPAPEWASERKFVASRNQVEEVLAGAFASLLQVERVGIEDDFFTLGGHSLLATRLVSRLRDALGVELPVRTVFAHPTVAALARAVESARGAVPLPPIERAPRGEALPQSYSQARLWFLYQLAPRSAAYNMAVAVRFEGPLSVPALSRSLDEIVRRHEVLRSTFDTAVGEPVQRVREAAPIPLPRVDLSGLPPEARGREVRRLARAEGRRPFDLFRGPVIRAALLTAGPAEHHLLLTLHHIAADGWSWGVLARELEALYPAYLTGESSPLPELPVQFADFAVWQRRWLEESGQLEAQLAYWREQLRGAPPLLTLATDRPRPEVQSFAGTHLDFHLPAEAARALQALGRAHGATLYMSMLAAFGVLLSRWSGQRDLVVGSPVANRRRAELESLVGFFVNTVTVRTDLKRAGGGGDPAFRELLAHLREATLGAFMHQDLPFEKLVEELQPERQLSHSPLFQVLYVYQNTPNQEGRRPLPDLTVSLAESEDLGSQFDLTLILGEEMDGGLRASLYYSTELFDAVTIERMWSQLAALVEGAAANPGARLTELPGLAEAEREVLIRQRNAPPARAGRERVRAMRASGLLPSAAELREFLASRLPEYMVPSAFVYLDSLPLTYSGKRDLRALPAPEPSDQDWDVYVAPRTPVEETLAGILAGLLKRERVGVESNLFEMGGHSLMVMQLIGRIREAFGVELTVQNVFETPTVAGLAALVDTWRWAAGPVPVPPPAEGELEIEEIEL